MNDFAKGLLAGFLLTTAAVFTGFVVSETKKAIDEDREDRARAKLAKAKGKVVEANAELTDLVPGAETLHAAAPSDAAPGGGEAAAPVAKNGKKKTQLKSLQDLPQLPADDAGAANPA